MVRRFGPWFGCIHLGANVYTLDNLHVDTRMRQCIQIVSDIVSKPLANVRVLDLACLEGHFGIEFALHGAEVIGIEARDINLQKAIFVKDLLSLNNLQLVRDDVRNLSRERYGQFDVILCFGILYHMDTPEAMNLIKNIFECCGRVAVIDTHFSLTNVESYFWNGTSYWGHYYEEHPPTTTEDEQLDKLWSSIRNVRSFVLTRPSLYNLLRHVGFTSVYECVNPYRYTHPDHPHMGVLPGADQHGVLEDRTTFVAIKGQRQKVMSSPVAEELLEINRPEKPPYVRMPGNAKLFGLARKLMTYCPEPTRKALSSLYHSMARR
jgi:predicted RNA methylase